MWEGFNDRCVPAWAGPPNAALTLIIRPYTRIRGRWCCWCNCITGYCEDAVACSSVLDTGVGGLKRLRLTPKLFDWLVKKTRRIFSDGGSAAWRRRGSFSTAVATRLTSKIFRWLYPRPPTLWAPRKWEGRLPVDKIMYTSVSLCCPWSNFNCAWTLWKWTKFYTSIWTLIKLKIYTRNAKCTPILTFLNTYPNTARVYRVAQKIWHHFFCTP